jgi:hypothetical protein
VQIEFYGLKDDLAKSLIRESIATLQNTKIDSVSVSFNHDPSFKFPSADFKVLILWEPAAVMPWQYKSTNFSKFDLVIPMSSWRARNMQIEEFAFHPYHFQDLNAISPFSKRERKILMINSAKYSAVKSSLYGLRRSVSKHLAESNIDYALYGTNWKMSKVMELRKRFVALRNSVIARSGVSWRELTSELWYQYPEYVGWVEDKFSILSQFEFSLVIENEADWVTEKIFDSIYAGTVPIYVGPDLSEEFPLIERCLIRANPTVLGVMDAILNTTDEQLLIRKHAIDAFVKDRTGQGIEFWSPENQWRSVSTIISKKLAMS